MGTRVCAKLASAAQVIAPMDDPNPHERLPAWSVGQLLPATSPARSEVSPRRQPDGRRWLRAVDKSPCQSSCSRWPPRRCGCNRPGSPTRPAGASTAGRPPADARAGERRGRPATCSGDRGRTSSGNNTGRIRRPGRARLPAGRTQTAVDRTGAGGSVPRWCPDCRRRHRLRPTARTGYSTRPFPSADPARDVR
jgi:hypothetical protein